MAYFLTDDAQSKSKLHVSFAPIFNFLSFFLSGSFLFTSSLFVSVLFSITLQPSSFLSLFSFYPKTILIFPLYYPLHSLFHPNFCLSLSLSRSSSLYTDFTSLYQILDVANPKFEKALTFPSEP